MPVFPNFDPGSPLLFPNLGRLGRPGVRTPPFFPGAPRAQRGAQRTNPGAVSGAPPTQQESTRDTMQDGVPPVWHRPGSELECPITGL